MSKLKLSRPIVFLDIESTGLDTQTDRIVELCVCKVTPQNDYTTKTYRYNPGSEIPYYDNEFEEINETEIVKISKHPELLKHVVKHLEINEGGVKNLTKPMGHDMNKFQRNFYDSNT